MDITRRLRGKQVAEVTTNGNVLRITTKDGDDIDIVWLDDNGAPIKGKPAARKHGPRIICRGMADLIHYPEIMKRGHA
jgi:hypothetical protein